ncbi:hypothetical protein ACS0TY_014322 [Phlomoides rotata]
MRVRLLLMFGGKTIVFGVDFGQILPVIPKGKQQDIVRATINSSELWNSYILVITRLRDKIIEAKV